MNTKNEVASRVQSAIDAAERTPSWVARKTGIALTTLLRKLAGGADFTVSEVHRIAIALGVSTATLLPDEFFVSAEKEPAA